MKRPYRLMHFIEKLSQFVRYASRLSNREIELILCLYSEKERIL